MGKLDGKVAMITGGARGQGRSHAVTFAREGASIALCDIAEHDPALPYPLGTPEELEETKRLVEECGQEAVAVKADVRDAGQMEAFVQATIARFGRIDVLCANAGVLDLGTWDQTEAQWDLVLDINLKGVWMSCRAVIPQMIEQGGGVIVCTSSISGLAAYGNALQYGVAKHGVVGLVRHLAIDLAPYNIRINTVCPTSVNTPMLMNQTLWTKIAGERSGSSAERAEFAFRNQQLLPIAWVEPQDVSNTLLWLVSDDARYITGAAIPIDGGALTQSPGIPPEAMARLNALTPD